MSEPPKVDWTAPGLGDIFKHHVASDDLLAKIDLRSCRLVCKSWHSWVPLPQVFLTETLPDDDALVKRLIESTNDIVVFFSTQKRFDHAISVMSRSKTIKMAAFRKLLSPASLSQMSQYLAKDSVLTNLDLSTSNISAVWLARVLDRLCGHKTLRYLHLGNALQLDQTPPQLKKVCESLSNLIKKTPTLDFLNITRFMLRNPQAAGHVGEALASNTTLKSIDIGECNLSDQELATFFNAMRGNTTLRDLHLSASQRLCAAGGAALAALLNPKSTPCGLTTLNLYRTRIDEAELLLAEALASNKRLTNLDLGGTQITHVGIEALCDAISTANQTLKRLELPMNSFSEEALISIGAMLQKNTSLVNLNMYQNDYKDCEVAAFVLAEAIRTNSTLQSLDLGRTRLWGESLSMICKSLQSNSALTSLHLPENNFGPPSGAATELAKALETNQTLKTLNLYKSSIEQEGVIQIILALMQNQTLEHLDLGHCELRKKGYETISELLKKNRALKSVFLPGSFGGDDGALAIAEALRVNATLETLNLFDNIITDAGVKSLAEALKLNQSLTQLDLGRNKISEIGGEFLQSSLVDTVCRRTIYVSGNPLPKRALQKLHVNGNSSLL
eukprot:TRINITY_DN6928_c0_g1_i1.p1 TRINITY_DN6928_c0_g1~~TRINITY_DN6928_c0_g1_i1.p1  ORF type:complete len:617 (+),score=100.07 TRINITY_DN6928_c0_g1_i1:256-2106(+)